MTKPVTRAMAVNCLLFRISLPGATVVVATTSGPFLVFKCTECGKPIFPGQQVQFDHIHADCADGPHEYENLRPIHYHPCHKKKTGRDTALNNKVKRIRGERKPKRKKAWAKGRSIPARPFPKKK